jgi:hypothetical protein
VHTEPAAYMAYVTPGGIRREHAAHPRERAMPLRPPRHKPAGHAMSGHAASAGFPCWPLHEYGCPASIELSHGKVGDLRVAQMA